MRRANVFTTTDGGLVQKHPELKLRHPSRSSQIMRARRAPPIFSREFLATLRERLMPDGVLTFNAYTAGVRAALDVFDSVAVAIPAVPRQRGAPRLRRVPPEADPGRARHCLEPKCAGATPRSPHAERGSVPVSHSRVGGRAVARPAPELEQRLPAVRRRRIDAACDCTGGNPTTCR